MAKYKNWPDGKKIPRYMMEYRGWVFPKEIEDFLPPDSMLDKLQPGMDVIYTFDGLGYSLFDHDWVDA